MRHASRFMAPAAKGRIAWLDAARGLGILAIVIGHVYLPWDEHPEIFTVLYAFHVPAFFFLSGLTFNAFKSPVPRFLRDRIRSILIPYVTWSLISILTYQLMGAFASSGLGRRAPASIEQSLLGMVWGNPSGHWMDWNKPLWFLPALFVTYLLGLVALHVLHARAHIPIWAIVVASSAPAAWLASHPEITLLWGAERSIVLLPFFLLAVALRPWLLRSPIRNRALEGIIGAVASVAMAASSLQLPSVDYVTKSYGPYPLFLLNAGLGTLGLVLISRALPIRALASVGRDSLAILCTHKFFVVAAQLALVATLPSIATTAGSSILATGLGVVIVALCVLAARAIRRVAPWSIGESSKS